MPKYEQVSESVLRLMEREKADGSYAHLAFDNQNAVRRTTLNPNKVSVWRPPFVYDTDNILYCPYYNRYTDKTQVFSFFKNDDLTRRSLHVQLVSRIARTIGSALNLNLDLIEAISLGHDIGHTPFGHAGERYLDRIYCEHTGRHFSHNIHSVRVLDGIFPYNLSLQTLDGIACHDGELELEEYRPAPLRDFAEFDARIESCYRDKACVRKLIPSTLEGCVVRISDIIAYLGKDRQDAMRTKMITEGAFPEGGIASVSADIINNLTVNIIENSYGKPYIKLDAEHFDALKRLKSDNYAVIYENNVEQSRFDATIQPMMEEIYEKLLDDLNKGNKESPIWSHHILYVEENARKRTIPYRETEPNQLIVDYIASMTDDYFIDLHHFFFPDSKYKIVYKGYFD